jgi:hypothetical protein
MIMGSVELSDRFIAAYAAYAAESGVPVLAVGYRLAPELPATERRQALHGCIGRRYGRSAKRADNLIYHAYPDDNLTSCDIGTPAIRPHLVRRSLPGVPRGRFAATDSVIHVISPPKSDHGER